MATAAQRAWLKRGREQAASTPPTSREYRGPTPEQIKAGTLAVGVPSTAHRKSARTAALTQSGMRAGQTPAQAAAQATKAVYGTQSTQAKQAQATLINEHKIAASRRSVIKDLRGGVIGGVKVIQTPHVKTLVDPHIHIRAETLAGKKAADYPTVASRIASMQKNQRRAYLQLTSDASKLQRAHAQLNLAEQRLNKAPIKDGVFVGTKAQYNKYIADYKTYTNKHKEVGTAINKYNSDIRKTEIEGYKLEKLETKTRRAQYGGLVGKYEDIETKVSKKIPTLYDISRKGAEFRKKHPEAANKLYTTFQKAHAKTEKVGTIEQRNALAGYTYGSYQSIQKQPVKTAAMVAVGMGSVKVLGVVGKIGKAYGAGAKTARVAQAAQLGLIGLYGKQSVDHIMAAPNSYVAGQRAAKIVYTELLPLVAGVKVAEVAPKMIKKIKTTTKRIALDESARLDYGKIGLKEKYKLPKTKIRTDKTYEQFLKEQKISKDVLSKTEYNILRASVSRSVKASRAKAAEYKARKEKIVKKVKIETTIQKKQLKPKDKAKAAEYKARSKVTKLEPIEDVLSKFARKQARLDKKFENGQIEWNTYIKQSKGIEKQVSDTMIFYEDAIVIVKKLKISPPKAKPRAEPASKIQAKLMQKRKQTTKTSVKTKATVKTATKTAQKVKAEVRTATKAKVKTKAQQKTKLATLIALRRATQTDIQLLTKTLTQLKAVTKEVQEIKPVVTMVTATTTKSRTLTDLDILKRIVREAIAEHKAATKKLTAAIRLVESFKFIVPPIIPKKKIPTKKKITKKRREVMILKQKNLNAVATFRDLLGSL